MDRTDIAEAIQLFRYSRTCQAGGRAADVLAFLQRLEAAGEIGFVDLGRATLHGTFLQNRAGFDLRVNPSYIASFPTREQIGALSLLLVHEGTHAAVAFQRLLDELAARVLPIHYFRELAGPGVFNEADDPPRPGRSSIVTIGPGRFKSFRRQSEALQREQLIDHILSIETYTDRSYIDADWVVAHRDLWRGLRNRRPGTKGLYVRILADGADRYYARHIVDILESIDTREEWDAVMEEAGRKRSLRIALEDVQYTDPNMARRIQALQRRWGMTLTEEPPVR